MVAAAVDAYRTDEILQENKNRMGYSEFWNEINQFFCGQIWKLLNHPIFVLKEFPTWVQKS